MRQRTKNEKRMFPLKTKAEKRLWDWLGHDDPLFSLARHRTVLILIRYLKSSGKFEKMMEKIARTWAKDFYRILPPKEILQRIADGQE